MLDKVLAGLYASEINVSIVSFWDGGFTVKLGDEINGFVAEAIFGQGGDPLSFFEVATWLDAAAREHYPNSKYAGFERVAPGASLLEAGRRTAERSKSES